MLVDKRTTARIYDSFYKFSFVYTKPLPFSVQPGVKL